MGDSDTGQGGSNENEGIEKAQAEDRCRFTKRGHDNNTKGGVQADNAEGDQGVEVFHGVTSSSAVESPEDTADEDDDNAGYAGICVEIITQQGHGQKADKGEDRPCPEHGAAGQFSFVFEEDECSENAPDKREADHESYQAGIEVVWRPCPQVLSDDVTGGGDQGGQPEFSDLTTTDAPNDNGDIADSGQGIAYHVGGKAVGDAFGHGEVAEHNGHNAPADSRPY